MSKSASMSSAPVAQRARKAGAASGTRPPVPAEEPGSAVFRFFVGKAAAVVAGVVFDRKGVATGDGAGAGPAHRWSAGLSGAGAGEVPSAGGTDRRAGM